MRKCLNLFLVAALAVGFSACNKDKKEQPLNPKKDGVTSMRMIVSEKTPTRLRKAYDAKGIEGESKVTKGLFITFSEVTDNLTVASFENGPNHLSRDKVWISHPFEYAGKTGTKKSGFILSPYASPAIKTGDLASETVVKLDKLSDVADNSGFMMSSKTKDIVILPNITEAEVTATTGPKNNFTYDVERLVAKVQVVRKAVNMPAVEGSINGKGTFTTEKFRFSVAGAAKKVYLFADKAGSRILLDAHGVKMYDGYTSAIHNVPATTFTPDPNTGINAIDVARDLTKVSDLSLVAPLTETTKDFDTFNSLMIPISSEVITSLKDGIYFYENSLDKEINAKGDLNFNDITYVKIYGQFVFAENHVYKLNGSDLVFASVSDINTDRDDKMEITKDEYDRLKVDPAFQAKATEDTGTGKYYYTMHNEAGTFFKGENNKYYYSLSASRADGNKKTQKYDKGTMVWMTPANNQMDATSAFTKYADTRRNNIYSMSLDAINGLGNNYDPIDPKDPNSPKPNDNPDEPTQDPIVPVDPATTHVKITANVLHWNVVDRSLTLK